MKTCSKVRRPARPRRGSGPSVTESAYHDQRSSQFRNARGSIIERVNVASLRQHEPRPGGLIPSRAAKQRDPAPGLRLRARSRCERLDREIAAGLPTGESPDRAMRASQLTNAPMRRTLAALYANVVDAADECDADPGSPLTVEYVAVIAARQQILELIERLRSGAELQPRGLALARLLVCDSASPIFRSAGHTVSAALSEITSAL